MGLWSNIVDFWKNLVSEFITNKQVDKWILDYDRRQEYNKLEQTAAPDQKMQLGQQMVDQWIVDPVLYGNYLKKSSEDSAKKLADPKSDESFQLQTQTEKENFRNDLKGTVQTNMASWDRYQKEVLTKAVDELSKQYESAYDWVMETYHQYNDPTLLNEWNKLKPEYEWLIKNSAARFGQLINQGKSYQDAYSTLIAEGWDKAKRIVEIQNDLMNKWYKTWIEKSAEQVTQWGLWNMFAWAYKAMANTISAWMSLAWQAIEAGKEKLWAYDTLEELNNLGVYKDNEKFTGLKTIKNRGYEVFDWLPSWLPEAAGLFAWNELFKAGKIEELATAWLKSVWLANKNALISKAWRFIADNMQDFLLNDAIAQASMGRPMTDKDIQTNWLMNIPINLGLSRLIPTEWMTKSLPIKSMNLNEISNWVMAYLSKDAEASVDDVAKALYLDQAYRMGIDKEWASKKILEGVGWDDELLQQALGTNKVKSMLDTNLLTPAQMDKYQQAIAKLGDWQKDIKQGKMTIDDMQLLDLWDRLKATKGTNIEIKTPDEAAIKWMEQYKYNVDLVKNNPFDKETWEGIRNIHSKVMASSLNNLLNQWAITMDQYKGIVENSLPEWSMWRIVLESKYNQQAADQLKSMIENKQFGWENARVALNAAYDTVQQNIIKDLDAYNIKPGTSLGSFTYLGKDTTWQDRFFNIFEWGKELDKYEAMNKMKFYDSNVSAKLDTYNDMLSGAAQKWAMRIPNPENPLKPIYDMSNTFRWLDMDKNLLGRDYVQGEMSKSFKPFGITVNKETGQYIITDAGLKKLSNAVTQFEQAGWNIAKVSKDQIDAYKVVFIKPYLQAVADFKEKGKDFVTYFEKLFKEQPDWTFLLDLKYKSWKKAGEIIGWVLKEKKDFIATEQAAADELVNDTLNGIVADMSSIWNKTNTTFFWRSTKILDAIDRYWTKSERETYLKALSKLNEYVNSAKPEQLSLAQAHNLRAHLEDKVIRAEKKFLKYIPNDLLPEWYLASQVKWLLNQYGDVWLEQKVSSLISFIASSKDKAILTKWFSSILWDILWDWKSNAYIKKTFEWLDTVDVYRNVISWLVSSDSEFSKYYMDNILESIKWKGIDEHLFIDQIKNARELLNSEDAIKKFSLGDRANMVYIFNKRQRLTDAGKIDIKPEFYTKYDTIKRELNNKNIWELSVTQMDTFSKTTAVSILERYGIASMNEYKTLYPKVQKILASFQSTFPDIKLKTTWEFKWIWVDVVNKELYINDVVSMRALWNLLTTKWYENYIFNHETWHFLTHQQIKENVKLLADKILVNVKALEELPEYKQLDQIVFYNKESLDKSMWTLDILKWDTNATIDKLIELSADKNLPSMQQLFNDIDEAVNEQQALYETYHYISDKDLVKKVKDKLELINSKLNDNTIVDLRKAIANKDSKTVTEIVTQMPQSAIAKTTVVKPEVKTMEFMPGKQSEYIEQLYKDIANWIENPKEVIRWETYIELEKHLPVNPITTLWDASDALNTSLSYVAWEYGKTIKKIFGDTTHIDAKNLLVGKETYILREQSGKQVPFEMFAANKVVANMLSSIWKYSKETIESINWNTYAQLVQQITSTMKKDADYIVKPFLEELDALWIDVTKWLNENSKKWLVQYISNIINLRATEGAIDNQSAKGIYEIVDENFNVWFDFDKAAKLKEWNEVYNEIWFSWITELNDKDNMMYLVDKVVDKITDSYGLSYDTNLIGRDRVIMSWLPYNSFVATLWLKNVDNASNIVLWLKNNSKRMSAVLNWQTFKSVAQAIPANGIKKSLEEGLAKTIELKIWDKVIATISKWTYDSVDPYKLLGSFIDNLTNSKAKFYELVIDGKSEWLRGANDFFNQIPGKYILEKLDLSAASRLGVSTLSEANIWILNKNMLEKIYDTLHIWNYPSWIKDVINKRQTMLASAKRVGMTGDEIENMAKDFITKNKLMNLVATKQDIDKLLSDARKVMKWKDLPWPQKEIYSKLRKYLYPDTIDTKWFMESINWAQVKMYDWEWYQLINTRVTAIKPIMDIKETITMPWGIGVETANDFVVKQVPWDKRVSTLDPDGLVDVRLPAEHVDDDFVAAINTTDGEFFMKIQDKEWKEIAWIGVMDSGVIKFTPMKDPELYLASFKDINQFKETMAHNVKEITEQTDLIKSILTC